MREPRLACVKCGRSLPLGSANVRCETCNEPFQVSYEHGAVSVAGRFDGWHSRSVFEEYAAFYPFLKVDPSLSLGEGRTSLLRSRQVASEIGLAHLFFKNETENPTWTFKDRGTACSVQHAAALGFERFGTLSSGNMGASVAAFGRRAGMDTFVLLKAGVPREKIDAIAVYQVNVVLVSGGYDDIYYKALEAGRLLQIYFSLSDEPMRVDGYKTLAFELFDQLDRRARDRASGRWPSVVSRAIRVSRSSSSSDAVVGECSWKCWRRTARRSPDAVVAHHERPSSGGVRAGRRRPCRGRSAAISSSVKTPVRWRNPAWPRKWACSSRVVVGAEAAVQVERGAVGGRTKSTAPVVWTGAVVEERAEDHPPVEEVVEAAPLLVEVAAGEEPHRRAHVVDEVGELLGVEAHRGRARRRRPARTTSSSSLERQRPARRPRSRRRAARGCSSHAPGHGQPAVGGDALGELVLEEGDAGPRATSSSSRRVRWSTREHQRCPFPFALRRSWGSIEHPAGPLELLRAPTRSRGGRWPTTRGRSTRRGRAPRGCRPAPRAAGRRGCRCPSRRSAAAPRDDALRHAGVGRRQRPDERDAQLGLALHRLAGAVQHVDHLVGRGVAARRRLRDAGPAGAPSTPSSPRRAGGPSTRSSGRSWRGRRWR